MGKIKESLILLISTLLLKLTYSQESKYGTLNFAVETPWKFKGFLYDSIEFLYTINNDLTIPFLKNILDFNYTNMTDREEYEYMHSVTLNTLQQHYNLTEESLGFYDIIYR